MRNIALIIEYDGSLYSGWQRQENAVSVQEVMEASIFKVTKEKVLLEASGRTDAKVHALGQVACFHTQSNIPTEKLPLAINSHLPAGIAVQKAWEASQNFHPRYHAKKKTYWYRIVNSPIPSPLQRMYACHERRYLDIGRMREQADHLIGEYDFTSFCNSGSEVENKVRRIYALQIWEEVMQESVISKTQEKMVKDADGMDYPRRIIHIEITGSGFLYNMVRIIVGTLMEIGKGKAYDIPEILKAKDRRRAGPTAQAQGLFLKAVSYEEGEG